MQQENKNKTLAIIFWILSAVCMGLIFYFSSRVADESAEQSASLLEFFRKIFGENAFSDFIVRKSAHFCEYVGLSLLLNSAVYFTCGKKKLWLGTGIASIYAITDEIHQLFVEGRSCEFRDWFIDTCGAITGMLAFLIIYLIIVSILRKREKKNEHTNI